MLIDSAMVESVIRHSLVRAVTFTGSESAGKKVAEMAGRYLKKTVLELGGSDPFIVLADADLENAVRAAVESRAINNGESCIAAKRFIVVEEIAGEFETRLVRGMRELRVGDPLDETTDLGPLARPDLVRELDRQVNRSVELGAKLLTGGRIHVQLGGNYYEPTVLGRVEKGMPAYNEELFGPVAAVIRAGNERDAVRIANDTDYGLGASIWTRDIDRAKQLTPEIDSGLVFVNGMVKSDPRLPFGGVKSSGYGRELSDYGIKEFVNIKTVWIGGRPVVASS
jgi:succinate-semialdehyde dehydrogenase/glutarate-semialdehyde dehydrogenase